MKDLTNINYVKGLQSNLRASLDTPQGKEVMLFLEELVGYDMSIFDPTSKENTWVRDGGRQLVATIRTLLKQSAEDIVLLAKEKEL
jgi:hypothetical protein